MKNSCGRKMNGSFIPMEKFLGKKQKIMNGSVKADEMQLFDQLSIYSREMKIEMKIDAKINLKNFWKFI